MNSAVLFLSDQKEYDLASLRLNDKMLIEYTIKQLNRLDVDSIFLVGPYNLEVSGVIKRNNIAEVIEELKDREGKCLLLSPFYPLIKKRDYLRLLDSENGVFYDEDIIPCFCLNNSDISKFESLKYVPVKIDKDNARCFSSRNDVPRFWSIIKNRIIGKMLKNGVIIHEPNTVSIGIDVTIDKNTVIGSYVSISGTTCIGKNNLIDRGSQFVNCKIGDDNKILDSKLIDCILNDSCDIGPNAYIVNSKLDKQVSIGSFVKLINCKVGVLSRIEHLSYIGDSNIGNDVNIGASVTTVNMKKGSHNITTIKDHSEIGNGVNLIAPIFIGEYCVVASGSTIDKDVENGDLAIARLYQQNKKGYGFKYTKEGAID